MCFLELVILLIVFIKNYIMFSSHLNVENVSKICVTIFYKLKNKLLIFLFNLCITHESNQT